MYSSPEFRKSSYSANESACVEVAKTEAGTAVRDTQNRRLGHIEFDAPSWAALLGTIPRN
ncbi:DUF397 domain-containing protein [Streptomonospora nanhaiensis]|uniref:DUF397 domain-containing protein n=1 Tax=Streptomonospora nanhaiensis TaxID=1323731 RepID=A0ABY6YG33_9ACTN|nr:DUF397 domain-containing protein [Streptomonospora nanhaiensis]WAE71210.1 DUF397 domain-containing protein [Streptomonospora nanhaiensis]